jgi:tetratricopeptide (TPR) repeat protein
VIYKNVHLAALLFARAQVIYCTEDCQRAHWKEGGHKKACKALQAGSVKAASPSSKPNSARGKTHKYHRAAATAETGFDTTAASGSNLDTFACSVEGGTCIICLEEDPPPIQSGCACRGDAGLAHIACRISAAEHKQSSGDSVEGWQKCPTCHQIFMGAMGLGLAEELFRRSKGKLDRVGEWFSAAEILSNALLTAGEFVRAEAVCCETFSETKRVGINILEYSIGGSSVMSRLSLGLGHAMSNQGKHSLAEPIYRLVLNECEQQFGTDDWRTLTAGTALGNCLRAQDKHAEAAVILKDVFVRTTRALGPEDVNTLDSGDSLASLYVAHDQHDEAIALYQQLLPVMNRVLGQEHKLVLEATANYALSVANSGKLAEALTMLRENVEVQKKVLGADHPSAMHAVDLLADIEREEKEKAGKQESK